MNAPAKSDPAAASLITLPIEGMSCASCVGRVEAQLKTVPGVDTVSVSNWRFTAADLFHPIACLV